MRKPAVTRTCTVTIVTALCADTEAAEMFNSTIWLPRTYGTAKKLLNATRAVLEKAPVKVVEIVDSRVEKKKFSMPEAVYINTATEIPINKNN